MNWFKYVFLSLIVLTVCPSCKVGKVALGETMTNYEVSFPYDFSQLKSFDLPDMLSEISGLTYDEEANLLLAVEDETGVIYSLDKRDGSLLAKDKFYKEGDYEGITMAQEHIYVLKSSGTIYKVKYGEYDTQPQKIKGALKKEFNLEGLTYDQHTNGLLVSCKEPTDKEGANTRCLFHFDLDTREMSEKPFLLVKRQELKDYIEKHYTAEEATSMFKKILNPDLDYLHLGPSGLAIHPYTKDVFILSSKSKCLLVYDRDTKALVHLQKLDKKIFEQPEGICFDSLGNLYISNESKKKPAQLVIIPIQKSKVKA